MVWVGPKTLIRRCAMLRPAGDPVTTGVKRTLRALARRWQLLDVEIADHTGELTRQVQAAAPRLLAEHGVGPDTAAALLIAAGDNPHRLYAEAAFAAVCGTNPIPASSGKTNRHRLNRAGDRQANAALHRIIVVRLRTHPETRIYRDTHRTSNGDNTMHVIRCLKRHLARRLYPLVLEAATTLATAGDRPEPTRPADAA